MRMILGTLLISVLAHGGVLFWALRAFPQVSKRLLWVLTVAVTILPACTRAVSRADVSNAFSWVHAAVVFELAVVFSGSILVLPLLWLAKLGNPKGNGHVSPAATVPVPLALSSHECAVQPTTVEAASPQRVDATTPNEMLPRRVILSRLAGATAYGVPAALFGWGAQFGRHDYRIEEFVARIPGLPKTLEGYTFAQISDIHVGLFVGPRELHDAVLLINSIKPDAVVLTGDLVDNDARCAQTLARAFTGLHARDGIYGIVGNHDHFAGAAEVENELERGNIRMLVNKTVVLRPQDRGGIALVGVDDLMGLRSRGRGPRFSDAVRGISPDLPRILLAHQPDYLDWIAGKAALQLSGHTHGGQINLGVRPIDLIHKRVAGRYEKSGTLLYVNRGFGVVGPPARLGAPPEITKIVLVGS